MDMSVSEFLMKGGVWETFNSLKRNTKMPRVLLLFGYQLW
jgi:hypothetical protein